MRHRFTDTPALRLYIQTGAASGQILLDRRSELAAVERTKRRRYVRTTGARSQLRCKLCAFETFKKAVTELKPDANVIQSSASSELRYQAATWLDQNGLSAFAQERRGAIGNFLVQKENQRTRN